MIFPLITFPYTSRILGPEGTGHVNFATSFVSYFILLASIGIPMYGVREIARVKDDKKKLIKTTQELFILHIAVSFFVFLVFLGLILTNGRFYEERVLFFITSFSIILTALGMEWLYQGLEEYAYITLRSIIVSAISTIAIFVFIHSKEDYIISGAIGVIGSLGSSILNFYNARKILFANNSEKWDLKKYFVPLMRIFLMNFVISIYIQLDTVLLGFLSNARNVGYYSSAMKLTKMLLSLVTSLGTVLLPRLSYHIYNGNKQEFDNLLNKSFSVILLLSIPLVSGLMLLNKEIILIFSGIEYLPAASCIIITAPVILFIGLTNIFGIQILYPLGKDIQVTWSVSLGALVSLILNIILIPRFAHIGAAISTLISEIVVFFIMFLVVKKFYPINLHIISILKYFFAATLMLLSVALIQYTIDLLWLRLTIALSLGAVVYLGLLILLKDTFILNHLSKLKNRLVHV